MLSSILTGFQGSLLWNIIRTKLGASYGISSSSVEYQTDGYFTIEYNCNPQKLIISIKEILNELIRIKNNKIEDSYFTKAKNNILTSLLFNNESVQDQFFTYIDYLVYNVNPNPIKKLIEYINNVTPDTIYTLCKNLFNKTNILLVLEGNVTKDQEMAINNLLNEFN